MSATGSANVRRANKASVAKLEAVLPPNLGPSYIFNIMLLNDLDDALRHSIWQIMESNMRNLYTESDIGWNPDEKREELFHVLSRFALVRDKDSNNLAGFLVFRFEYEDGEDLIYCYELQVSQDQRRRGIGTGLMNWLEIQCKAWKMDKIMLTVFKANKGAKVFYSSLGFSIDPCSPTYKEIAEEDEDEDEDNVEEEEVDYDILSKPSPIH